MVVGGCGESTTPGTDGDDGTTAELGSSSGDESSSGEPVMPSSPQDMVLPLRWELTPAAEDPFPEERPTWTGCELGWGEETGLFEVDTELCLYGSFTQTGLAPIDKGDLVELVMIHDALFAPEPAVAHVAIAFGDEIAWETEIEIPAEAAQLRPSWTAENDVPGGTPVHLHVHNHGTNNYRFVALTVQSQP